MKKVLFALMLFVIFWATNCTPYIEEFVEYIGVPMRNGDGFTATPAFLMILIMIIAWRKK